MTTRIEQAIAKLREAREKANKDIYGSQDFAILSANVWQAMVQAIAWTHANLDNISDCIDGDCDDCPGCDVRVMLNDLARGWQEHEF